MNIAAAISPEIDDKNQELIALARLLTYAKDTAGSLGVDAATFCISSAITAILEQLGGDDEGTQALRGFIDTKAEAHC